MKRNLRAGVSPAHPTKLMSNQQPNDDPPLVLIRLFAVAVVIIMILTALWFSKEPTESGVDIHWDGLFLQARNKPIDYLDSSQENYLISKAPPFLITRTTILATVTAYNPVWWQTDDTPLITASGKRVQEGFIACPSWIPFGTEVEIDGRTYICEDRMSSKYPNRFDIMMWSYWEAKQFGRQNKEIEILQ